MVGQETEELEEKACGKENRKRSLEEDLPLATGKCGKASKKTRRITRFLPPTQWTYQ
jgi:hypothetical protein